ncbi:MAG: Glu-tRNA(Gln) amidotransferase subunit GatE [Thermoproteota archaeon]|nr:Glu-tRNA(Gln) amidotransferase subunit GatE [Thermoproteota archaeon]
MSLDLDKLNVKVGFEIHQQLNTSTKLFCDCDGQGSEDAYDFDFIRVLRPTKSELGDFDRAALFEHAKMSSIKYYSKIGYSCLVEADEEPPHNVNKDALETALLFSLALNSNIVDEIHVMRKLVIDGSNVSGFQRTMLVSTGGYLEVDNFKKVGVQGICLEEDAAKLISTTNPKFKEYGLDRLGIPLVEIALEPISGTPAEIVNVALTLGRLLRSSKRVTRGIGSIRQDVNISVNGGQVVEVKGVQQLSQLIKVLDYETKRQYGMIKISEEFRNRNIEDSFIGDKIVDVTSLFITSSSNVIKKILKSSDPIIKCIRLRQLRGLVGYEPVKDIRIGKELGEFVRFFGLGGLFHSDELPNYGITAIDVENIEKFLDITRDSNDAFIIIGGNRNKIDNLIGPLIRRIIQFKYGVIAETRSVTLDGTTIFSRPRPGSSRMYPETDIMPIPINLELIDNLKDKIPLPWNELIKRIMKKHGLNMKLSEQIFDSDYYDLFESIVQSTSPPSPSSPSSTLSPTFVASKLTEDIVSLSRNNLDKSLLTDEMILEIFNRLEKGLIAKESVILIFEKLMKGESVSVQEAINSLNLTKMDDAELYSLLDRLFNDNINIIREKGANSMGVLMGKSMAVLRGKVDGSKINDYLKGKLETFLKDG